MLGLAAVALISSVVVVLAIYFHRESMQLRQTRADLEKYKDDVLQAEQEFRTEYDKTLYFSKRTLHMWEERWRHIKPLLKRFCKLRSKRQIQVAEDPRLHDTLMNVNDIIVNGTRLVEERNKTYVEAECERYKSLFDTLGADPLSPSQRRAIVTNEHRTLVVAGAGTGKTSTIVGKVWYILRKGLAEPSEILLLAFADEAKREMEERVSAGLNGVHNIKTFHALGRSIITESRGTSQTVTELKDTLKLRKFIRQVIGLDMQHRLDDFSDTKPDPKTQANLRDLLLRYFIYHLHPYRSMFEFTSYGEYIDYIKENQIRSLKGDIVKSYEECEIANFLYTNGICYEYEKNYEISTASRERRQYAPDFYLHKYGIYIEHFGIRRDGEVAPFMNKESYLKDMAWKRRLHKHHGTRLVETFSYEKVEGTLLTNLEKKLKDLGVRFQRLPDEEVLIEINDLGAIIPFVEIQAKFLNLFKSGNFTLAELREKAKRYSDWERYQAFLNIFAEIYEVYMTHLHRTDRIDFNDMIKQATKHLRRNDVTPNYRYILVDEFQDISQSRYNLLKSLLDKNPSCKLFCVGDDWQSIYRFTGSDLSIMTTFAESFEFASQISLDETFRLNNKLCDFSTRFIMRNKDQISKTLVAASTVASSAITIIWSVGNERGEQESDLLECLDNISSREEDAASVFVIGRYKFSKPESLPAIRKKYPKLNIKYHTAHKAKGREADYVIVLDLKSDRLGFPCKVQDDPVLNLVLAKEDTCQDAEERRVFYVAITRAKKHVYLLANSESPSAFIKEILREKYECEVAGAPAYVTVNCPDCHTGLIIRREHQGSFFSCSNYPYCNYKAKTCPKCKEGFMYQAQKMNAYQCSNEKCSFQPQICPRCKKGYLVTRRKYTEFLGCSNYPACRYTQSLS